MNLLHICCNFAGTSVFADLFTRLADLGVAQQVYVPEKRAGNMGARDPHRADLPVHYRLIVRPWDRFLYYTKARRALPDLLAHVRVAADTLVHAHTLFTDGGLAYRLHRQRGTPYVVTIRATDVAYFFPYMPHLRGHGLKILRAAQRVVFLSPAHRDTVLTRYVPARHRAAIAAKSAVIPNGLDAAWLDGTPKAWQPGQPLRLAFAGKLNRVKQPLVAVEAVAALRKTLPEADIALHIAGSGSLERRLRAHPGIKEGWVVPHGQLTGRPALKAFYHACHLFLLPSTAETFGLVYLEAMSQGLPVLYTRGQGFDGQFPEGEVGFAIDPRDPAAIAAAAQEALVGYAERSARCVAAAAALTWEVIAQRWLALYQSSAP